MEARPATSGGRVAAEDLGIHTAINVNLCMYIRGVKKVIDQSFINYVQ